MKGMKMKKHMLEMLKKEMKSMMGKDKSGLMEDLDGLGKEMSKVTVMSDSPEGLVKGLSKAEEIMKAKYGEEEMEDEDKKKKKKS